MTEPCDLSATEARLLIGARRLSPVELLRSFVQRVETVDHAVNAIVARDFEAAQVAAKKAEAAVMAGEELGLLHGLPIGVKDLEDTKGLRTTYGSAKFTDHLPVADQNLVADIRRAGGIILGKTNTSEFGLAANACNEVYGTTRNPFDPVKAVGGSSGGSAAALATGMVPLATGSELGGSLRSSAAFCGVVGMRPTPGLVPSEKRQLGALSLSSLGPMARSVADLALLLSAIARHERQDMLGFPGAKIERIEPADLGMMRIAFSHDLGFAPTSQAVRDLFAKRNRRLAPLFAVADNAAPDCSGADEIFCILRAVSFLAAFGATYRICPDQLGAAIRANVEEGMCYSAEQVAGALAAQTLLYQRWQKFFDRYDLLITPSVTIQPRHWTEPYPTEIDGKPTRASYDWVALTYAVTIAGHPAISLPLGTDADGMPFGIQLIGKRHGDTKLLQAALALEFFCALEPDLAPPVPNIAALASAPALRNAARA